MSSAVFSPDIQQTGAERSRGQTVWLVAVQCIAVGLLVYTLWLAGHDAMSQSQKALLAVLAVCHLAIAIVPAWRGSQFAGALGAVTLATAYWLSAGTTLDLEALDDYDWSFLVNFIPMAAPIVALAALTLAIWGASVRACLADASRLGVAAVGSALLLAGCAIGLYRLINGAFATLYMIESYQLVALLASVILYPAALWLGSAGVRSPGGTRLQSPGMAAALIIFLVYWQVR